MITVSLIEYPAIVKTAATVAKLNSNWKIQKKPIVKKTSWISAIIAPKAKNHSNLNQI